MMWPRSPITWVWSSPCENSKTDAPPTFVRFDFPSLRIVAMRTAALNFSVTMSRRKEGLRHGGLYLTIWRWLAHCKTYPRVRARFYLRARGRSRHTRAPLDEERVDCERGAFRRRHRVDDASATARIDAVSGCRTGRRVRLERPVLPQSDSEVQRNPVQVPLLPHHHHCRIATHQRRGDIQGYRPPSTALVRRAEIHLLEFDPLEATDPEEALRSREELEAGALIHRLPDLLVIGGHLFPGPAVDDGDLLRPEAQRRAGAVHRDVAPSDHDDPRADRRS